MRTLERGAKAARSGANALGPDAYVLEGIGDSLLYLVDRYGSYNLPFIPMTAFLLIGVWLWLNVDPAQALIPQTRVASANATIPVNVG